MKLSPIHPIFAAVVFLAAMPAHSDLTIKSRVTVDIPNTSAGAAPVSPARPLETTTYESGTKIKRVSPISTTIMDLSSMTETVLFPGSKKFLTAKAPEDQIKRMSDSSEANVTDMNVTKTILGHETHLFKLYFKSTAVTMTGFAWVAKDLPTNQSSPYSTNNPMLNMAMAKMSGRPLKMTLRMSIGQSPQKILTAYQVTAISTDPIPASAFDIPSDYTQMQKPGTPGN